MKRQSTIQRALRSARRAAIDVRGATAVEFAIVAAPFFLFLFGIIEVAMVFFATVTLEHAAAEAARDIRTGEVQDGGGQAQFEATLCDNLSGFLSCGESLYFDVRTFEDFGDAGDAYGEDGVDPDELGFDPGEEREIVLVRVFYEWQLFTPMLGKFFESEELGGNKRLLTAAAAFRNEPFGEGVGE